MEIQKIKEFTICERHEDERGHFQELYKAERLPIPVCKQINWSFSNRNVIRGIHVAPYGKLVTCTQGRIWDVVIDLRPDSSTYMTWQKFEISGKCPNQVFVPANCGHGFMALDDSHVIYAQSGMYNPKTEHSIRHDSPILGIKWPEPIGIGGYYILSEKDLMAPRWFMDGSGGVDGKERDLPSS